MIEAKRVAGILADLEALNEDLLNLYEEVWREAAVRDVDARRQSLRTLAEYNDRLEAFADASERLRDVIGRLTSVETRREARVSAPLSDAENDQALQRFASAPTLSLDERFTFRRPIGFTLLGVVHPDIRTWTRMHGEVCAQLAQHDPERFSKLPEVDVFRVNLGTRFTTTDTGYRTPLQLPLGLYCEAHLSSESIRGKLRLLLRHFDISEGEIVIYLREDRDAE